MVKTNVEANWDCRRVTFHCLLIRDPWKLQENRNKAIAIAAGFKAKLLKNGTYKAYHKEL